MDHDMSFKKILANQKNTTDAAIMYEEKEVFHEKTGQNF